MMEKLKGHLKRTLPFGNHTINVATPFPILVSWNGDPVRTIPVGTHRFTLRQLSGELALDVTEPKDFYGFSIVTKESQKGELIDDLPPPEPAPADNFLKQMRARVEQQRGVQRENFDGHRTPYQDAPQMFEEELYQEALHSQQKSKDSNSETGSTAQDGDVSSPEDKEPKATTKDTPNGD